MNIHGIKLRVTKSVLVSVVTIGPAEAKVILEHMSKDQRKLSPAKVREWAKEMTTGRWKVSNDALVYLSSADEWVNGQHRLHAIIESGTEQDFIVLATEDASIIRVLDGGKARWVSDVLRMQGCNTYSKDIAGVGYWLLSYDRGLLTSGGTNMGAGGTGGGGISIKKLVTRQDRIEFCEKNAKRLTEIITYVRPLTDKYGSHLTPTMAYTLFAIIAKADGDDKARDYVTGIITGDDMSGAQKLVRTMLIRDVSARRKLPACTKLGMALKAYLSHRNGTIPGLLILKSNEAFPKV